MQSNISYRHLILASILEDTSNHISLIYRCKIKKSKQLRYFHLWIAICNLLTHHPPRGGGANLFHILKPVCMFDKFHLTFNFKSKVSRDVFKNEIECQSSSTFSSKMPLQCQMPSSMCHFKFLKFQLTYGFFLDKSHYMSKFKLCVSIDVHFIFVQVFVCQMPKTCKNFVKHIHCLKPCVDLLHPNLSTQDRLAQFNCLS